MTCTVEKRLGATSDTERAARKFAAGIGLDDDVAEARFGGGEQLGVFGQRIVEGVTAIAGAEKNRQTQNAKDESSSSVLAGSWVGGGAVPTRHEKRRPVPQDCHSFFLARLAASAGDSRVTNSPSFKPPVTTMSSSFRRPTSILRVTKFCPC